MEKQVVGYGVMLGDEICRDPEKKCFGKGEATIYVSYNNMMMIPSCKDCTPLHSCKDKIADVFSQLKF